MMDLEVNATNWTRRINRHLRSLVAPRAIVLGVLSGAVVCGGNSERKSDPFQVTGNVPTPLLINQMTPAIRKHFAGLPTTFTPTSNPLVGLHRRNDVDVDDEHTTLSRMPVASVWSRGSKTSPR